MERGWKPPNVEISPPCPRCGSSNTKFCYYNNYSLNQPRYFCKGCRRYWTKGGSLRNVPVGGGCRKSRRGNNNNNKPFRNGTIISIPNSRRGVSNVGGTAAVVSLGHIHGTSNSAFSNSWSTNGRTLARSREEGTNNIDLALVYANFLNQKPMRTGAHDQAAAVAEPHHLEIPIFMPPNVAIGGNLSSFHDQFSSVESIQMMDLLSTNQLSQESNATLVECRSISDKSSVTHFSDGNAFYFSGLDSIDKQQQAATDYDQLINSTIRTDHMNQINNCILPTFSAGEKLSTTFNSGGILGGSAGCCSDHRMLFHGNESSSGLVDSSQAVQDDLSKDQSDENRSPFNVSIELCNIFGP
ncbi:hypothetical protein ACH5RR_004487 [Cinchona calisaya]|uniref:Dof zinc finger protein n=1 Tax=Cinchona calisaya TaxID=153742 RepID=A0ABD3AXV2_9GENT